jgi:hypothetical protein
MQNKTELIGLLHVQAWIPGFEHQTFLKVLRIAFVPDIVIASMWVSREPRLSHARSN